MIASINFPGSTHFDYFHGNKVECKEWLEAKKSSLQESCGGLWPTAWLPALITPDKRALAWKYRDGSAVIKYRKKDFPGQE